MSANRTRRAIGRHLAIGLLLSAAIAALVWYGLSRTWALAPWLAAWFAGANVVTFAYYGWDKARARLGQRRVPEVALHALAAAGGSLGAYGAMHWFRHKTIKGRFRIVFWMIVALQVAVIALVVKETWF